MPKISKGIDPNIRDENGDTVLEVTGNFEIAKMLLEHSATVYSKQQMGKILYHCGHNP
ncbi:MAG: ankyrin repeat domain-containing protein [Rickettsia endosymbiont of Ixodes ricinus]|uniref:Ankyrin repeat protein n=1 Tax=Rickettsia helvetica TaxID=35789 RepID=A0ABM9NCH7_RICHE|nr:ankyrin repeat domain-containing protein [Rickettsia helvetica]MCZ6884659.1 ankyrin repeat domain-containing protein [Rickettsia endosymbiont of Ixodes ricinus]MCZ6896342.1 ankyrin repeat domain-containing protein [Rickettsia endosymbiont of Ixodes ricinus]